MEVKTFTTDIDDFIEGLDIVTHSKVSKMLDMLEEFENELEMPYSRSLSNGLFELRIKGQTPDPDQKIFQSQLQRCPGV